MPEEVEVEIEIGRHYFRHLADEQKREAEKGHPGQSVEVREVMHPYAKSQRPTYVVVLVVKKKGEV